ncbi:MAG: Mrp/NBP35 family ATP-binding protein [Bdellovibrionales bacterium]|nr:Mrp/NBP35 family ATP-binding protein [Bdellovibrionales bacterium]
MAQAPNPFEQQQPIPGVQKIIAVASGKGGVGKSTVATSLAVAMAQAGYRVGLLDADIYGPSIPRMMGALGARPEVDQNRKIQPIERYGIKLMSIGFLIDENAAVVWRGPMLFKAMDQFFRDVAWGELDFLFVDLPPGTGDIQLSLAQKVPVAGAVCVSTPQDVALMDVKKSIDMFHRVSVPLLGLVENMAYMLTPSGERIQLFPKGQLDRYLEESGLEKLGEIPFQTGLSQGGEIGIPLVKSKPDSFEAKAFAKVAARVREKLGVAASSVATPAELL